jgi:[ribosomal protein S5]-alanine N-acetyltransferase
MTSVALSAPSPADAGEFIAAVRASEAQLHPWVDSPDTADRFTAYLNRAARADQVSYLIRHTECGGLVGYANINNIVWGALQSGYLGYAGFFSHAGRGLMTAGLAAVITDAFGNFALHRLEANIQPDNARSLAMVRRLGFRREGFSPHYLLIDDDWRDHERWAILSDDWGNGLA